MDAEILRSTCRPSEVPTGEPICTSRSPGWLFCNHSSLTCSILLARREERLGSTAASRTRFRLTSPSYLFRSAFHPRSSCGRRSGGPAATMASSAAVSGFFTITDVSGRANRELQQIENCWYARLLGEVRSPMLTDEIWRFCDFFSGRNGAIGKKALYPPHHLETTGALRVPAPLRYSGSPGAL